MTHVVVQDKEDVTAGEYPMCIVGSCGGIFMIPTDDLAGFQQGQAIAAAIASAVALLLWLICWW